MFTVKFTENDSHKVQNSNAGIALRGYQVQASTLRAETKLVEANFDVRNEPNRRGEWRVEDGGKEKEEDEEGERRVFKKKNNVKLQIWSQR